MRQYLVETYASSAADPHELSVHASEAAASLAGTGVPIRHITSILIPSDETCFHLFEADSADTVRRVSSDAGMAAPRIVEAAL